MITRLSAMIIASREDVYVEPIKNNEGKWGFWITYGEDRHHPLIDSNFAFSSREEADMEGHNIVKACVHAFSGQNTDTLLSRMF